MADRQTPARSRHGRVFAGAGLLAWAGALQLHMLHLSRQDAFRERFSADEKVWVLDRDPKPAGGGSSGGELGE